MSICLKLVILCRFVMTHVLVTVIESMRTRIYPTAYLGQTNLGPIQQNRMLRDNFSAVEMLHI